ncbi:MAG: hypothetical protein ACREBF_02345 [Candidatus Micrarchaeales archaeon]
MKIFVNSNKTVIVASGGNNNCPRCVSTSNMAKFKDDFYGKIRISKKATKLLFSTLQ